MSKISSFFLGLAVTAITFFCLLYTFGSSKNSHRCSSSSPFLHCVYNNDFCCGKDCSSMHHHGIRQLLKHNTCPGFEQEADSMANCTKK